MACKFKDSKMFWGSQKNDYFRELLSTILWVIFKIVLGFQSKCTQGGIITNWLISYDFALAAAHRCSKTQLFPFEASLLSVGCVWWKLFDCLNPGKNHSRGKFSGKFPANQSWWSMLIREIHWQVCLLSHESTKTSLCLVYMITVQGPPKLPSMVWVAYQHTTGVVGHQCILAHTHQHGEQWFFSTH